MLCTDGWPIEDKREYLALLERKAEIAEDRERAEREERGRVEQAAMMAEVERDAEAVRKRSQSFAEFVKLAWPIIEPGTPLKWNWHMQAMCDHLEAISRGKLHPRLIINVPPGSSKSTIVTVLWQAYEWGPLGKRHLRYVSTSYELTNVKRDTAKTRDVLKSAWFIALWPEVVLKTDGVLSYGNTDTGTRLGVAFDSVTGKRGDRLLVDDPHSLKGAESEVQRKDTIQSFIEGGLNRVNDWATSVIVIVMQRLHEEDLTGALLAKDFGFIHLMIPLEFEEDRRCTTPMIAGYVPLPDGVYGPREAIRWTDPRAYDGELMDPVRFPEAMVEQTKLIGEYSYNGQYQQRPAPREGGMFKVDKIEIVEFAPAGGRPVRGWDLAASKNRSAAYTAGVKMKRVGGVIYVLDVRRDRWGPAELRTNIKLICGIDRELDPTILQSLPQDPAAAGLVQKHDFAEQLIGFNFKITTEGKLDKPARAEPFAAYVGAGMVKLVKGAWNKDYTDEMRVFPAGRYKDQIDASSRAFGEIVQEVAVTVNAGPELVEEGSDEQRMAMAGGDDDEDPWGG